MHLADPKKAPVRGDGRRKSEVGRMLRRQAGQEDLGDLGAEDEDAAIDPVLRNILGLGAAPAAGRQGDPVRQEQHEGSPDDDEGQDEFGDDGEDQDGSELPPPSFSSSSSASAHRPGARADRSHRPSRRAPKRRTSRPPSTALNLPPRGAAPLRGQAMGYMSLLRGDAVEVSSESSGPVAGAAVDSRAETLLRAKIISAARTMMGAPAEHKQGPSPAAAMPFASYAERRAALREDRDQKIQARMMEMVHKGQMPPELLLDDDLAQSSKLDADSYENDPDAYDTDELLGSDASSISETDEDNDTPEECAQRARRRDRRRRQKVRMLKRRKRQLWAKKRRDIEDAKSRYYDDMIDQLVRDNPGLRPPAASADLESKRAFVDRATAENLTRSKIEQMARWIFVVAVVVENLGMITGFLMLEGLSQAVDAELRKPEMQPLIAQLARKYLRRGPSSPEWGLAIMFLGTAGTVHAMNVRQQEIAQASAGQGAATGPGSSKFGKVISGAMKVLKVLGITGTGAPEPVERPPVDSAGAAAAATIASRYNPPPQQQANAAGRNAPPRQQQRPVSQRTQSRDEQEDDTSRAPWE
jgi:hypothetical protein